MTSPKVRYLVFDVESVADGDLVATIRYPGEKMTAAKAVARFRGERMEKYNTDFIPYPFQIPISIGVAKVDDEFNLLDVVTLDEPEYRSHVIVENFWRGWVGYEMPTLVSYNGRGFDIPLLELAAYRYGISVPEWFNLKDRGYDQKRNRYNIDAHLDLQDLFTNYGATKFHGGLNLLANMIGSPGKMDVSGHMVQDLFEQGKLDEINDYCRCDVLDTYFVFLRAAVMTGWLVLEREQEIVAESRNWLNQQSDSHGIYADYLAKCTSRENPWQSETVH